MKIKNPLKDGELISASDARGATFKGGTSRRSLMCYKYTTKK